MPLCEATGCNRETFQRMPLERDGDRRHFGLCRAHQALLLGSVRYGVLHAEDGSGCWRPPREIYRYTISFGEGAGGRSANTRRVTLAEAIRDVSSMAGGRPWSIYETVVRNENQHDENLVRGELRSSSWDLRPDEGNAPGSALWRRIGGAVDAGCAVDLSADEAEMLAAAGLLSGIETEFDALDRLVQECG